MAAKGALLLQAGERPITTVRSHPWPIVRAALPLPLLLLLPIPYTILDDLAPDLRLAAIAPIVLWLLGAAIVLYAGKWVCLDLLPWIGQSYVLTDRRVIAQAGVFSVRQQECSLLKIEKSDYVSRGPVRRLLDIGDVEVETSGRQGTIVLRAVHQPRHVQGLIDAGARALREEETRRRLAEAPDDVLRQLETIIHGAPSVNHERTEPIRPVSSRAARAQQRLNLLPDEAVVEVVRQHPVVLVSRLALPLAFVCAAIAVVAVFGLTVMLPATAVVVVLLGPWAVWRILGYMAHEYVLTTDRLMELRSAPFLFETRDVVRLSSVQDVTLEIPTLVGRLANTGDVVVEVAGPARRVALKTVEGPARLQKLIFETIEARQRQRRDQEDQRLVSTLTRWFQEYHRLQGQ